MDGETNAILKEIRDELRILRRLSELQLRRVFKDELEKIASSNQRKMIWAMADGTHNTVEIAKKVGSTLRAVQYFVQDATDAGFLKSDRRGYPMRTIDWVPPEWQISEKIEEPQKSEGDTNE